jgi:hypothetical protein
MIYEAHMRVFVVGNCEYLCDISTGEQKKRQKELPKRSMPRRRPLGGSERRGRGLPERDRI